MAEFEGWAGCVSSSKLRLLAPLRLERGLEGCVFGRKVWVKGDPEVSERLVDSVSWDERYDVMRGGRLVPHGCCVPTGYLPKGNWDDLQQLIELEMPLPEGGGRILQKVRIRLSRSGQEERSEWVLAHYEEWRKFMENAPSFRFRHLRVAFDWHQNWVLVKGSPPPSIRSTPYYQCSRLIVPSGFSWEPQVDPQIVEEVLGLGITELGVFFVDGTFSRMRETCLRPASRMELRLNEESSL